MKNTLTQFVEVLLIISVGIKSATTSSAWYTANDGRRYFIESSGTRTWFEARDTCAILDLQLVVLDSHEKNRAFMATLATSHASHAGLWIGHYDRYNSKIDKNRPFYSASTGRKLTYSYWHAGEPSNDNGNEHCAHILGWSSGPTWNDMPCDQRRGFGFVCEEHYLTTRYRQDMIQKQRLGNQTNSKVSADFTETESKLEEINENEWQDIGDHLVQWKNSTAQIVEDFQKALNELTLVTQQKMANMSHVMWKSVENVHANATSSAKAVNLDFENKLSNNTNYFDQMLQL